MKIGIGITTYNREHLLNECYSNIVKNTKNHFTIYVARDSDEDRRGIAKRKNECLHHLRDCDYIFLFDDDCYPIKEGWESYIINKALVSKENHFVFNDKQIHNLKQTMFPNAIEHYEFSGGVMMFLTKSVIEKVGGFHVGYDLYGYEHIGYSSRIMKSGLNSGLFISPQNMNEYFFAHDYHNLVDNISTMKEEDKLSCRIKNKDVYYDDIKQTYQEIIWTK
jgi:GT2 family glycosyltransferase